MLTTRFKLPPLEGDDVAMMMERDMLRRWGFLGKPQQQQNKRALMANKNKNKATVHPYSLDGQGKGDSDSDSDSSSSSSLSSDDDDDDKDVDEDNDEADDIQGNPVKSTNDNKDDGENKHETSKEINKEIQNSAADTTQESNRKNHQEKTEDEGGVIDENKTNADNCEESCDQTDELTQNSQVNENNSDTAKVELLAKENNVDSNNEDQDITPTTTNNQETPSNPGKGEGMENSTNKNNNMEEASSGNNAGTESGNITNPPEQEAAVGNPNQNGGSTSTKKEMSGEVLARFQEATRHYEDDDYCECMLAVEEALELCGASADDGDGDDECDVDVTQLWLLRAKVMNSMENYKEALRSAYKVMAKERPSRLWIEGAIAMEKMGIQVTAEMWIAMGMHKWKEEEDKENDVTSAVTSAEDNMNNNSGQGLWDAGVDSDILRVLKLMQKRLRIQRIYGPLVSDKPIKVISSLKCNKAIHATRKIKKGETIFQEVPDILEQSISTHRITACAECAKSLLQPEDLVSTTPGGSGSNKTAAANTASNLIADIRKALRKIWPKQKVVSCSFCREVKYCSDECRKNGWDNHHKVICPSNPESTAAMLYDVRRSFRDVMAADGSTWQGWWNTEFSPTLLSRMIAIVLCKANLLADLRAREHYTDSHWSMCEAILDKYSSCEKMHSADQVPKMHELLNNIFKRSKFLRYEVTKDAFNKRYSQALTNVIKFHDTTHPMNNFAQRLKSENEKLYKKIKKNHNQSLAKSTIPEFHGLFPLASSLNHSCYPNAAVESVQVEARPGIAVKAVRDIREGDELFIAYIDPQVNRPDRRKILWKNYKFVCECPRCLHQGIGPHVCTHCGKTATDYTSPKADTPRQIQPAATATEDDESKSEEAADVNLKENASHENELEINQGENNTTDKHGDQQFSDVSQSDVQSSESGLSSEVAVSSVEPNTNVQSGECLPAEVEDSSVVVDENNSGDDDNACQENSSTTAKSYGNDIRAGDSDTLNESLECGSDTTIQNGVGDGSEKRDEKAGVEVNCPEICDEEASDKADSNLEEKLQPGNIDSTNSENQSLEKSGSLDGNEPRCAMPRQVEPKTEPKSSSNGAAAIKFAACSRCKKAWYCSTECQKDSWVNGHKRICNAAQ